MEFQDDESIVIPLNCVHGRFTEPLRISTVLKSADAYIVLGSNPGPDAKEEICSNQSSPNMLSLSNRATQLLDTRLKTFLLFS